jgi:hypothetical protein
MLALHSVFNLLGILKFCQRIKLKDLCCASEIS